MTVQQICTKNVRLPTKTMEETARVCYLKHYIMQALVEENTWLSSYQSADAVKWGRAYLTWHTSQLPLFTQLFRDTENGRTNIEQGAFSVRNTSTTQCGLASKGNEISEAGQHDGFDATFSGWSLDDGPSLSYEAHTCEALTLSTAWTKLTGDRKMSWKRWEMTDAGLDIKRHYLHEDRKGSEKAASARLRRCW